MIVLTGFMGSGKTTVGRILARGTGLPFADTDALIEAHEGASVAEVFATKGEPYFREVERKIVTEVLDGAEAVVALGGGAVADPVIAAALEWANVVYLETSFQEVWERMRGDADAEQSVGSTLSRPLLQLRDPRGLYEERVPLYRRIADFTVTTDNRDPETIAAEIEALVFRGSGTPEGARRVVVPLGDRSYEVLIGNDLLERLGDLLPEVKGANAFVITHPTLLPFARVAADGLRARGLKVTTLEVPEGETSKSLDHAGDLLERLGESAAHRRDLVVSVGGGVVCDIAGFVASLYARGMPLVHVPTSLLGQVDAAIGGKTGVNLGSGKNLIGTFYQPQMVLCDTSTLDSLPEEELRSGLAEVVKYGLISEPDLLDLLVARRESIFSKDPSVLEEVVARSVWIKAAIVADDELDLGKRRWLNYGHTFAHAIENSVGYGSIRHGEAVALGMMAAAHLSNLLGWLGDDGVDRHRRALEAAGLPTTGRLTVEELEPAWLRDKKYEEGVGFVLLTEIGSPIADVRVEREDLRKALESLS